MKNKTAQTRIKSGLVGALDVGTTKTCCFIARVGAEGTPRIVGIGHQASRGMRAGTIVDMEEVEATIRATVEAAERMAGENIEKVVVNLSGGAPESRLVAYDVAIGGHEIGDADLRRILDISNLVREQGDDRQLIHAIPVSYSIDGSRGVRDPRGMYAHRLGVNMHAVSASSSAVRNLAACINHCHLGVDSTVVSAYASALTAVNPTERKLGAILVEMGGGTTTIAVFYEGNVIYTDIVPVGGNHVTSDVARGLSTPLDQAERAKTLWGSAMPSPSDDREILKVQPLGDEASAEANSVPRSVLVGIIRARVEETLELVA